MNAPAPDHEITLDDKYALQSGRAFMTGTQALVRLPMLQRVRDLAAGLNTAGFISGYRGSPVGGFDQALWKAGKFLDAHHVKFQPGVNEDLAATSIWGTQQVNLFPDAKYDGVFAMWYGKGPGVDRCGDVFKHANSAGTSRHGGVLVLAGDDHAAKSSTLAHQSEHIFKACCIPVLNPASVQEYLDLGLHGIAMSRFSGCWVAFKCVTDVIESGAVVEIDPQRVSIVMPPDFAMPPGGLNIRWPDAFLEQEARLLDYKVYAALAYCRANRLDRIVWDNPKARFGIVTTGKSFGDTLQALADLGIDERVAADAGIRLYKVAMSWPLEPQGARRFAEGLEEILVVEEKRQVIEYQIKEELYNWREGMRPPRVVGKFDDNGEWSIAEGQPAGNWLLPAHYELCAALIAKALANRFAKLGLDRTMGDRYRERVAYLEFKEKALAKPRVVSGRLPYFCSGCPHNTSTQVPEGSRAMAGIGCHFMALWMDRNTATFTHMGGEGAPWIGQAHFTDCPHVFANIGDGTYFHSGLLAIRAAVAAGVNMTYKILYNDAVAMTGGQHFDGPLDPAMISRQIAAEGVQPIVAVVDEKESLPAKLDWAPGTTVRPREDLDAVQRELREKKGVSAIIYVQTCATEKRRRRKRKEFPDPAKRVVINEMVCEGCGDCSVQSNCLSVEPLETEFGRKRTINQSSCNKDYSCLKGFCPSFVTVEGGTLKKGKAALPEGETEFAVLPQPRRGALDRPFGILVTGIGGMGVITIGQIVAMAAHLEGKGATVLDMSGLAQKFGPVMSHVRIARSRDRAERGCRRIQSEGFPLGAARRNRPRAGGAPRDPGRDHSHLASVVAKPRRADRAQDGFPHRLPRPSLRRAIPRAGGKSALGGSAENRRERRKIPAHRGRRKILLQADGLQGRIRGGAPVLRPRVCAKDRGHVRRRLQAEVPPCPADLQQARSAHRRGEEVGVRTLDDGGVPRSREIEGPARHAVRCLRYERGAQGRTAHDRRVRGDRRRVARAPGRREPKARRGDRERTRAHPRFRSRQAAPPGRGEEEGSRAARRIPRVAPFGESRVEWPSPAPTSRTTRCGRRFARSIRRRGCSPPRSSKLPSGTF